MDYVASIEQLEALYGQPAEASILKVATRMTPGYRAWITASRFCVLSTVGSEGTDGSPRGDDGPVVTELDPQTLAMPDWRGNNRMDSLRNIVTDGRVSLMFMVPGARNVVRVNGHAKITTDAALIARFETTAGRPRSVIIISIAELYSQCARAVIRADLWSGEDQSDGLPSMGDILREMTEGRFDGAKYDKDWPTRAAKTMW